PQCALCQSVVFFLHATATSETYTLSLHDALPIYGCVGQETTGAGGLAKALRTVPVVLDIAERARRRAAAGAWIIDFTNPVGIVTDRKSTRLNSSHVSISYAVFCLKKKKN